MRIMLKIAQLSFVVYAFSLHWIFGIGVILCLFILSFIFEFSLESQNAKHQSVDESTNREKDSSFSQYIGREVSVILAINPSGQVEIEKQRVSARSTNGFIESGEVVKIVEADLHGVVVERV